MMEEPHRPAFIAVDWGTTRLRATLLGRDGGVLGRAASDSGVQSVARGAHETVLEEVCGPWLAADDLPVLMAGMVGSRNGWVEVPYVSPVCDLADLARGVHRVEGARRRAYIVPGVDCRSEDGTYDVMRGEEVQAFGAGVHDGLVCLPGTHSKWVGMVGGRIARFVTFATGELYAALTQSFVGRLAEEPEDRNTGRRLGERIAALPGGLARSVFQARTQVLAGNVSGHAVRPFLSALLIESEVLGARAVFGAGAPVSLVAAEPQLGVYAPILERHGFAVTAQPPDDATLRGLMDLAAHLPDFSADQRA